MTSRERSAVEQDRRGYALAYLAKRKLLADLRTMEILNHDCLQMANLKTEMLYHLGEQMKLEAAIEAELDLAGRMARQARDLHLELLERAQ